MPQWRNTGKNAKNYWTLLDPGIYHKHELHKRLAAKKSSYNSTARHKRLVDLDERMQRGMIFYDKCTVKELRKFCKDRGIVPDGLEKMKKAELISWLEGKDEFVTFDKLFDLPAELRCQIYTLHIQDLPRVDFQTQPPLTKTDRLVRKESLPIFYGLGVFGVDIYTNTWRSWKSPTLRSITSLFASPVLQHIRHLNVTGVVHHVDLEQYSQWGISLGTRHDEIQICRMERRSYDKQWTAARDPAEVDAAEACVKKRLEALLEGFKKRGNKLELRTEDRQMIEGVFGDV